MRSWAFHGGSNSPDASCRPVWYREQQLQRFNAGEAIDVSRRSIYRWADHLEPEDVEFSDESVSKESSDEELMRVKQSIVR